MYCIGCGRSVDECDGTCRGPLEPPRFCPTCARKLDVQVTPQGFTARCRKHGPLDISAKTPSEGA